MNSVLYINTVLLYKHSVIYRHIVVHKMRHIVKDKANVYMSPQLLMMVTIVTRVNTN